MNLGTDDKDVDGWYRKVNWDAESSHDDGRCLL